MLRLPAAGMPDLPQGFIATATPPPGPLLPPPSTSPLPPAPPPFLHCPRAPSPLPTFEGLVFCFVF